MLVRLGTPWVAAMISRVQLIGPTLNERTVTTISLQFTEQQQSVQAISDSNCAVVSYGTLWASPSAGGSHENTDFGCAHGVIYQLRFTVL